MEKQYIKMIEKEELTREEFLPVWKNFKDGLNKGEIRVEKAGQER